MKETFKNLKFAWQYAKDQKLKLILYIITNIINIGICITIPILGAQIIVKLTENLLIQVVTVAVIVMFIEWLRNLVHYMTNYFSQVIYRETFTKMQNDLGSKMLQLENSCIDKNSSGVFIQRLTNDTSRIADVFNVLNISLTNIITNIGIFSAIFIINKWAFLFLMVMITVLFIVNKKRVEIYNEKDKLFRKKNEKVSGFIGELVRGIRDIKMLNAEKSFMNELNTKIVDLNQNRYSMSKTMRNYNFISGFFIDLFDTGMIILLVYLVYINQLTIASALVVHNYMNGVQSIVFHVNTLMEKVKDFNLSSERIFKIIESEEFPKEKFGNTHLDKVEGNFEFKNVSFKYEEEKVLNNISFKVNANETIAFVGKSGAGKSTIFSLLCKMYEVNKGTITIDGVDIKELDKESIRGNITIISQNPYIFNLSIRDNLRLVKEDITDDEMIEACRMACLEEFIEELPDKYDTIVGEGGISLSGGQRQRLAIARAFVQKTEIILFDEATSALDNETQASIQKAIDNMKKDYTILIIAHRLSTVINSDRILFLNKGKIESEGTHQELLKNNVNYKNLYEAEIKK